MSKSKNIAIIGGGPSGLMAAQIIVQAGHRVTIYERMPSFGRKFMMAGRGGLNLTHSEPLEKFTTRYQEASNWLAPHIESYPPKALQQWCENLGQETFIGSSGRVFPRAMKASPLLRAWLKKLEQLGVQYNLHHDWQGWDDENLVFKNSQNQIVTTKPDATFLALGGASWPNLGSNGAWTEILAKCGVEISALRPANCGFIANWSDYIANNFAGTAIKSVAISHQGISCKGEIMVTKQGLEGGAIYALSANLREYIKEKGSATVHLDLRPEMSLFELAKKLQTRGKLSLGNYLRKAGFPPLTSALLHEAILPDQLKNAAPDILAGYLKTLPITLTSTTDIARAISTAGGITRQSLDENFMLKAKPGVFAAGEMLDWEAPTGGYLLQACFSTANSAAKGLLKFTERS